MSTLNKNLWTRHTVAVPTLTRTYERVRKAAGWTKDNKKGVHVRVDEMVHQHDVYRQLDSKGRALPDLWWRGARVS